MDSFAEWVKKKTEDPSSRTIEAMTDIAKSLAHVFEKYTLETRRRAWGRVSGEEGQKRVHDLIKNPKRSVAMFRTLGPDR